MKYKQNAYDVLIPKDVRNDSDLRQCKKVRSTLNQPGIDLDTSDMAIPWKPLYKSLDHRGRQKKRRT